MEKKWVETEGIYKCHVGASCKVEIERIQRDEWQLRITFSKFFVGTIYKTVYAQDAAEAMQGAEIITNALSGTLREFYTDIEKTFSRRISIWRQKPGKGMDMKQTIEFAVQTKDNQVVAIGKSVTEHPRFDYITDGADGTWSQICQQCVRRLNIPQSKLDNAGHGICGVRGCNNQADYYIDF